MSKKQRNTLADVEATTYNLKDYGPERTAGQARDWYDENKKANKWCNPKVKCKEHPNSPRYSRDYMCVQCYRIKQWHKNEKQRQEDARVADILKRAAANGIK